MGVLPFQVLVLGSLSRPLICSSLLNEVRAWCTLSNLTRDAATAKTKDRLLSGAAGDYQQQALLLLPAAGKANLETLLLAGSSPKMLFHFQFFQWTLGG